MDLQNKFSYICRNNTANYLKVGQHLLGLTLRINPSTQGLIEITLGIGQCTYIKCLIGQV